MTTSINCPEVPKAVFSDRPIRLRADIPVAKYHPVSSWDGRVVPIEPVTG